jgi:hypothetical protein
MSTVTTECMWACEGLVLVDQTSLPPTLAAGRHRDYCTIRGGLRRFIAVRRNVLGVRQTNKGFQRIERLNHVSTDFHSTDFFFLSFESKFEVECV